ncbi:unnamed protein product [Ceutorhynchus assimilis]|uniref:OTU domain-containing protein n=1 Tax=Ceutorhynchus assimilis TaxID=467358 RepID=A0A9P0DP31_9CUCU|nr:unnamed protein product [Ceutorhynchus assimilis]
MSIWKKDTVGKYLGIQGDGNCLFRALSVGMGGNFSHEKLREILVNEVRDKWDEYANNVFDYDNVDHYYREMMKVSVWGSYAEIFAFSNVLQRRVVVISDGREAVDVGPQDNTPIVLRFVGNNHYDLYEDTVIPLPVTVVGAAAARTPVVVAPAVAVSTVATPAIVAPAVAVAPAAVAPVAVRKNNQKVEATSCYGFGKARVEYEE